MFKRQGQHLVCAIHPGVKRAFKTIELKNKHKAVEYCPRCDQLVEELKGKHERE